MAVGLKDPLLATRCKLYLAYSLLQQGKLKQAARIIRLTPTGNVVLSLGVIIVTVGAMPGCGLPAACPAVLGGSLTVVVR